MYLERFVLPTPDREERLIAERMAHNGGPYGYLDNAYPCGLFAGKALAELSFAPVTILYGGNGSGKSTLLNLIACKLALNRLAPHNASELFDAYAEACEYELGYDDEGFPHRIPNGSRIVTSDDVFDYMLAVRTNNDELREEMEDARWQWGKLRYGKTVKLQGMGDYEALRLQVLSRRKSVSRRQFIRRTVGTEAELKSNGETALAYFEERLKNDTLYLLDEPENSLSAEFQLRLADILREAVRYCGCQLVIATHSPFLLATDGARIFDLDARPVAIRRWWELENMKAYARFFRAHKARFD